MSYCSVDGQKHCDPVGQYPDRLGECVSVRPSGFKNSSLRISPGGTGRIPFFFICYSFMIVHDFNVMRTVIFPSKTDPPLVVDPDTVFSGSAEGIRA